jgi:DNA-binding transcriptional ArsR family regulator
MEMNSVTTILPMLGVPFCLPLARVRRDAYIQAITLANDHLNTTFAALADPTRRQILGRLAEQGEANVTELAEPFPITVQAVSQHLKVLEQAGLITRGRRAQLRPSRLEGARLKDAAEWLAGYRHFWDGSFDLLDARLKRDE